MGKAWAVATAIGAILLQGTALGAALTPLPGDSVALPGHVLPALDRASAVPSAKRAADTSLTLTIVLRRSDQAGFDRYLLDVYDPASPRYGRFLDAAALADRFGPSADDIARVQAYFEQRGFATVERPESRMTLSVAAPQAVVEAALGVAIGNYELGERRFFANAGDPQLPPDIATRVQAVVGMNDLAQPRPLFSWFRKQPCKESGDTNGYNSQNIQGNALQACIDAVNTCAPKQKLDAAELSDVLKVCDKFKPPPPPPPTAQDAVAPKALPDGAPPWKNATGAGQKVGLIQFDTFVASDVADYLELFGLPETMLGNLSQVHVNGGAALGPDQSEVLLDINTVMMGAPDAKVVVYDAPFAGGSFQALFNRAISDGMTVISNSWAYCEDQTTAADVQSIDAILATAAGAGISVFNASGDTGSTCLDGAPNTIVVPGGSPNATAVGGTSLKTGPTSIYASETWWNGTADTPPTGQGGFGVSRFFARPAYQNGFTTSPTRSIPDLAFNADPAQGIVICQASLGGCPLGLIFGGTSMAAPSVAAAAAVMNQAAGRNLGNYNLALYPLAGTSGFHSPASMGSDFAHVGLGSPNFNKLYLALTAQTAGPVSSTVSKISVVSSLVAADGTSSTAVVVRLRDADGNAVSGKTVTLAAVPAGTVSVTPASAVTSEANGAAVFRVRNAVAQSVTFTATDTSDGVVLQAAPVVVFGVPPAASGGISANSPVQNDGIAKTTITVTLKDGLNRPTPGKVIALAQGAGRSIVSGPVPAITDANGQIQFTATDTFAETVTYTAVDVTDGDLPIPGSAQVTFGGQASFSCVSSTLPTAAAGYTLTPFSTGYATANLFYGNVNWGCRGAQNPAFTPDGGVVVTQFVDGSVYRLPAQGGVADNASKRSTLGPTLFQPVTGKDGRLYAARGATTGDFFTGAIFELEPRTGAILRTVLQGLTCPTGLTVDPLSGDLFFSDSCFGAGSDNPSLWRVRNPAGASPALEVYATLPGTPTGWIAFAPDGTIFMPQIITQPAPVLRISGTDKPQPATLTPVPGLETSYWVTVAQALPSGAAKSLIVLNGTTIRLADITTSPPTFTDLIEHGPTSGVVGPDGCLYVSNLDTIYKLAPAAGGCGFLATSPAPAFRLTPDNATAVQGADLTLTARFENVAVPANTPVFFALGAANAQTLLGRTDGTGKAVVTYRGIFAGVDQIEARATIGNATYRSNAARITWTAGRHATFLSLDTSPTTAATGATVALRAVLVDISASPPTPIVGAPVQLTLGAASCAAVTDAHGAANCAVVATTAGSSTLVATFAGNASYVPADARQQLIVLAASASVAAAPLALDFGDVAQGVTSPAKTAVLTNAGGLPFTLSTIVIGGANAGDFAQGGGPGACVAGATLAAGGGTCTLYVTFKPTGAGARAGLLTVTDNVGGSSVAVPLSGSSGAPVGAHVTPAPTALDFGGVPVGTNAAARAIVLTNSGTVPFALTTVGLVGPNATEFALAPGPNACVAGGSIAAAGGSCTLYVTFAPTTVGPRSATVAVADGPAALAVNVPVSGSGSTPSGANVTPAPLALDFGAQEVGTTSAGRTVVLTNTGSAPFALSGVAINGAHGGDFVLGPGGNACVAGNSLSGNGGTCTLYVVFRPSAAGVRTANVAVTDGAAGVTVNVPVSGNGVPPAGSCFTGGLPAGGAGTACVTGALPACTFASAAFVPVASVGTPPPQGVAIPYGLFAFTTRDCGATATVTLTYPAPLVPGTTYYKFGPTAAQPVAHWYTLPALVSGNTLSVTFVDGGAGDSDLAANGAITDPGGAGVLAIPPLASEPIPTLDRWALLLLALLLGALAAPTMVRRR